MAEPNKNNGKGCALVLGAGIGAVVATGAVVGWLYDRADLKAQVEGANGEKDESKRLYDEELVKRKEAEKALADLQAKSTQFKKDYANLQRQSAELLARANAGDARADDLTARLDEAKDDLNETNQLYNAEQQHNKALTGERDEAKRLYSESVAKLVGLEKSLSERDSRISGLIKNNNKQAAPVVQADYEASVTLGGGIRKPIQGDAKDLIYFGELKGEVMHKSGFGGDVRLLVGQASDSQTSSFGTADYNGTRLGIGLDAIYRQRLNNWSAVKAGVGAELDYNIDDWNVYINGNNLSTSERGFDLYGRGMVGLEFMLPAKWKVETNAEILSNFSDKTIFGGAVTVGRDF